MLCNIRTDRLRFSIYCERFKNYDDRDLILEIWRRGDNVIGNLSAIRTDSMASFIGHFDFLSILPVGPIVNGNSKYSIRFFKKHEIMITIILS